MHPDDVRNGRLTSLLQQMTIRAKNMMPGIEFEWFVCSAIQSTRAGSAPATLIGKKAMNNTGRHEVEFAVPALPDSWPDDWGAGEFRFTIVLPNVSKNLQIPPKHIGLDRLFDFLIRE